MAKTFKTSFGSPHPLGASTQKAGVNFSVFSKHAAAVELLLFAKCTDKLPFQVIQLDPTKNRTYYFWHVFVEGLKPGCFYAYRVDGAFAPEEGHRFNKNKVLIDPYSKGIDYTLWKREDAVGDGDNLPTSLRSVVIDSKDYDWEGDQPLNLPLEETIIYEMHVAGFTKSPTSGCDHPGKFAGVVEKLPYLRSLGVNAVELMPVFDFDMGDAKNYWGYGTMGFFAPESSYCLSPDKASHVRDFRDLVKAMHRAGLEVILDIVFGYTTEGNENGPTLCLKGFDNSIYYHLPGDSKQYYMNFSGCGNTLNSNHPVVSKFIQDCLEYWALEMHVDGFRFDLASLMSRDENGNPVHYPHVLWNIDLSDKLAKTKLFVEPWDAAGLYQVGNFPGRRFVEWNGRFRDDMRRFVKGDKGLISTIATRIIGSSDLYEHSGRLPINSLNFITAHDGFTLYDLVSYNEKHNEANGEDNRDGNDDNISWNCGAEGDTDDSEVNRLRFKQIRNFFTLLLLSKGIPMIQMGDEVARSQKGNNNAYCQNNEISWFDWDLTKKNEGLLEFFKRVVDFRKHHRFFYDNDLFVKFDAHGPEIVFHGTKLDSPAWDDPEGQTLAYTLNDKVHVMINMSAEDEPFELPRLKNKKRWHLAINTADDSIGACPLGQENIVPDSEYFSVENRSIVVLVVK